MFVFQNPGQLVDDDLELVLVEKFNGDPALQLVPSYKFRMVRSTDKQDMGRIDLRIGTSTSIVMYAGHIGYSVFGDYRGHHYAARSVKLLLPLARKHGLNPLWITCNPDNFASRRACELAGGRMIEIVDLPEDNEMYQRGERQKCRYRLDL
ncbi:MAG: GNAT family N-acetyltransferase [Chloroflexota bacterium]